MTIHDRIRVAGDSPYDVLIGSDLAGQVPALLPSGTRKVAVIHPAALGARASDLAGLLAAQGSQTLLIPVPDGEPAKSAQVTHECWQLLGAAGFTRSDAIIGYGGGATTDLAGFVAATWLRGIPVVHVPTTLLGMVDAAVGGKTGINTAQGKNLVGAFHPPAGVVCDVAALTTLPREEMASGLAEVVKCGFICDPTILSLISRDPSAALDPTAAILLDLITRAVQVKASVVAGDLREQNPGALGREVLNYGHTFGHAIEQVEHFQWRHGEAVAVGMVFVAELARLVGRLSSDVVTQHRDVLTAVGLPTSYPEGRWSELHSAMRVDKKSRGDVLRFVVLDAVGAPAVLEAPAPDLLTAAYAKVHP